MLRPESRATLPPPPLPAAGERWALFLDVDGTLLDLAATPGGVTASPSLIATLGALHGALDGAVALLSGRQLADVDALFAPLRLPAAGLHGLQWRGADASEHVEPDDTRLGAVRSRLQAFADLHPGLLLEDKGQTLALHFRRAPRLADACGEAMHAALSEVGKGFLLQGGKFVWELRPRGAHKGEALLRLAGQPPFRDRHAVFAGDDLTDEEALRAARSLHGIAIAVGERHSHAATHALPSPFAVRRWLESLVLHLSKGRP